MESKPFGINLSKSLYAKNAIEIGLNNKQIMAENTSNLKKIKNYPKREKNLNILI